MLTSYLLRWVDAHARWGGYRRACAREGALRNCLGFRSEGERSEIARAAPRYKSKQFLKPGRLPRLFAAKGSAVCLASPPWPTVNGTLCASPCHRGLDSGSHPLYPEVLNRIHPTPGMHGGASVQI